MTPRQWLVAWNLLGRSRILSAEMLLEIPVYDLRIKLCTWKLADPTRGVYFGWWDYPARFDSNASHKLVVGSNPDNRHNKKRELWYVMPEGQMVPYYMKYENWAEAQQCLRRLIETNELEK